MKKHSFYLYSPAHRDGRMFTDTPQAREELVASGEWFESPAELPPAPEPAPEDRGTSGANSPIDSSISAATLLGSSVLPSILMIEGAEWSLGRLVLTTARRSGLSVEAWNGLPEDMRELLLDHEAGELGWVAPWAADQGTSEPTTNPAPTPAAPPKPTVLDATAVQAIILQGKGEEIEHSDLVTLAKALNVKTHKVKKVDLLATLTAKVKGEETPAPAKDGEKATDEQQGTEGGAVPPLQPKQD